MTDWAEAIGLMIVIAGGVLAYYRVGFSKWNLYDKTEIEDEVSHLKNRLTLCSEEIAVINSRLNHLTHLVGDCIRGDK